jgi:hypothetical protein
MKKIISAVHACVLLLGCVFALASCGAPAKDPAKAEANLKGAGYQVKLLNNKEVLDIVYGSDETNPNKIVAEIKAVKGNDFINIFYYDSKESAKEAWKTIEAQYEATALNLKESEDLKIKYGREGAVIYIGTKAAVKAAK